MKTNIILFTILCVLLIFAYYQVEKPANLNFEREQNEFKLLYDTGLSLTNLQEFGWEGLKIIHQENDQKRKFFLSHQKIFASDYKINQFLQKLSELKIVRKLSSEEKITIQKQIADKTNLPSLTFINSKSFYLIFKKTNTNQSSNPTTSITPSLIRVECKIGARLKYSDAFYLQITSFPITTSKDNIAPTTIPSTENWLIVKDEGAYSGFYRNEEELYAGKYEELLSWFDRNEEYFTDNLKK